MESRHYLDDHVKQLGPHELSELGKPFVDLKVPAFKPMAHYTVFIFRYTWHFTHLRDNQGSSLLFNS